MARPRLSPIYLCFIAIVCIPCFVLSLSVSPEKHRQAKTTRIERGHDAAVPLYKELLECFPEDVTAASRIAGSKLMLEHQANVGGDDRLSKERLSKLRRFLLRSCYTNQNVARIFGIGDDHQLSDTCCPIYLTPSVAGEATKLPFANRPQAVEVLSSLFLLGHCVEKEVVKESLSIEFTTLLIDLVLVVSCETEPSLLVPCVQIFPVQIPDKEDLFIITDWHPRVLATSDVAHKNGNAVMYVGPDTLALIHHWLFYSRRQSRAELGDSSVKTALDLCSGCGIQALVCLAVGKAQRAVCVDVNERALRFSKLNALLNGLQDKLVIVHGDIVTSQAYGVHEGDAVLTLVEKLQKIANGGYHVITCNPPFLPLPDNRDLDSRFGLFSAADKTGEAVLAAAIRLSRSILHPKGILSIVSEFFFSSSSSCSPANDTRPVLRGSPDTLLEKIRFWWSEDGLHPQGHAGLLLRNEYPISISTYAERRSESTRHCRIWQEHLTSLGIDSCSPGLLFLWQRNSNLNESSESALITHCAVPRSPWGSLWTPSNPFGVNYTKHTLDAVLRS